ncbi:MAG: RidA family protein [Alphaproteobacteria bacterium]|nr:RidA family protein [Alphaproteobacteria bacterium]
MLIAHDPSTVSKPVSLFAHAIEVPPHARWLYVSGQVGVGLDGKMRDGIEAQCEQAWRNLFAIVEAAGMNKSDLVRVNSYLVDARDVAVFRTVRDRLLAPTRAASTLVVVRALASPQWLVEIEAVAAKG